jgi:hypothetical protein
MGLLTLFLTRSNFCNKMIEEEKNTSREKNHLFKVFADFINSVFSTECQFFWLQSFSLQRNNDNSQLGFLSAFALTEIMTAVETGSPKNARSGANPTTLELTTTTPAL